MIFFIFFFPWREGLMLCSSHTLTLFRFSFSLTTEVLRGC